MAGRTDIDLVPITDEDIPLVAEFLHENLNRRLSPGRWAASIRPSWSVDAPNHGFMLRSGNRIVGVNLAFYSQRTVRGEMEDLCNLAALCILEEFRPHAFRLIRALLGQRQYSFTDLSPSGNVVELDRKLGFAELDTTTFVFPNLWWPPSRRISLVTEHDEIDELLSGLDLQVFRDHKEALAAQHLVLLVDGEPCYVMFRKVRRKRLPFFAAILYVGRRDLFPAVRRALGAHLLIGHGAAFTLAERRLVGTTVPLSRTISGRPKMLKSRRLAAADADDLYSELTCVPW